MFEVQMLIPLCDNAGQAFSVDVFAAFESAAVEALGGFTLYPANVLGGWRDDAGRDVRDSSRVYAFAIRTIGDGAAVLNLAARARETFRQDAIFIRYLGQAEVL
jgi:hypothetical protein